jgi:hypothetical protein
MAKKSKTETQPVPPVTGPSWLVVEGIHGTWHYHLRDSSLPNHKSNPAACGAAVMHTGVPITAWDKTPPNYHLREKWCAKCAALAGLSKG